MFVERRRPLNAARRYQIGFLGALFLVLLRIAIGWHFLTEGIYKVDETRHGKPFSAEIYLRNANGPFAPYFRGMLEDPNGLALLDPVRLKKSWADLADGVAGYYGFDEDQKGKTKEILARADLWADYWFNNPENAPNRQKYLHDLRAAMLVERDSKAMSFEKERAWEARKSLEAERKTLTAPLVAQGEDLKAAFIGLATPDQRQSRSSVDYQGPTTFLHIANVLTMYGLIAMGICLILGLFTPFAALCAVVFLGMIYLSMPPLAGLPESPKLEGHYWIVNKNLVELVACLLVAATASGHWVGLDALLFGARRRRRLARREGLVDDLESDVPSDHSPRAVSRP